MVRKTTNSPQAGIPQTDAPLGVLASQAPFSTREEKRGRGDKREGDEGGGGGERKAGERSDEMPCGVALEASEGRAKGQPTSEHLTKVFPEYELSFFLCWVHTAGKCRLRSTWVLEMHRGVVVYVLRF